jgi:hypothetical protein
MGHRETGHDPAGVMDVESFRAATVRERYLRTDGPPALYVAQRRVLAAGQGWSKTATATIGA